MASLSEFDLRYLAETIEVDLRRIPDLKTFSEVEKRRNIARAKMHGAAAVFQISHGLVDQAKVLLTYTMEEMEAAIPGSGRSLFQDVMAHLIQEENDTVMVEP